MNTRRAFIRKSAAVTAAPFILPSRIWSAETPPSERIVMAFIGMGKQNRGLLGGFIGRKNVEVVAVCDVDTTRREAAKKQVEEHYAQRKVEGWKGVEAFNDFREIMARTDIDAVCIATPDHWHAIQTLAALDSKKDVYCEKPLTHNVHESKAVMAAVEKNQRVLQTGSMQRSSREFRVACEVVRNGHIGKISHVECSFGGPGSACDLPEEPAEPGLDWKLWLGPAEMRPYHSELSPRGLHNHFPNWRHYIEYGGGYVTDWGAHHLDIASWGLGMDDSGPVEVLAPADALEKMKKRQNLSLRGATLVYANGVKVTHIDGDIGVRFHGSEGTVACDRGKLHVIIKGREIAKKVGQQDKISADHAASLCEKNVLGEKPDVQLYKSSDHLGDFIECVKARKKPITNEIVGGRSAIICHLMNIAYHQGVNFKWDPAKNDFAEGSGKAEWLSREYHGEFKVV